MFEADAKIAMYRDEFHLMDHVAIWINGFALV